MSTHISRSAVRNLLDISARIRDGRPVSPEEADKILHFSLIEKQGGLQKFLSKMALPGSILLGMSMAAFSPWYTNLVTKLPQWTNMSDQLLSAVDYVWSIIGKPVKQKNIIYHIPNVILYSFGVIGVKKLFEYLRRKSWLDKVTDAKSALQKHIAAGNLNYNLRDGHSVLFVGNGDFIGQQFYLNNLPEDVIVLGSGKPFYTNHWLRYEPSVNFDSLLQTLDLADGYNCGEYILFPVTDTEIFLPAAGKYDLSPEKVEVMIQSIRDIERLKGWTPKRIIIVGDKKQESCIQTESPGGVIDGTTEFVSLESVSRRFENIIILDPTELVLEQLLARFPGRRILFRASVDGASEYKLRFYERLKEEGYDENPENEYTLVVGYDLFEEQIERESIATSLQEYIPVVLSREVCDALQRNGYAPDEIIYVPDLVLTRLRELSS